MAMPTWRLARPASAERGSGTALMATVVVAAGAVAIVGIVGAGYLAAAHRARAVADLAALSGAAAVREGGAACPAAQRIARAQTAHVVACGVSGDALDFVVTVTAAVPVPARFPGLPRAVTATAHAGLLTDRRAAR